MLKQIDSSSGLHTHKHEHNRPDASNTPGANSNTSHHNPYNAYGTRSGYYKHEHPHQHHVPERQHNMEDTDDTGGPVTKYHFEEEWFRNSLHSADNADNDVGSWGDDVNLV